MTSTMMNDGIGDDHTCHSDNEDTNLLAMSSSSQQDSQYQEDHTHIKKSSDTSSKDETSEALCGMISKLCTTMDSITSRLQHLESTVQFIQTPGASSPVQQVEALPKQHAINASFTAKTAVQQTKVQAAFMTPSTAPPRIHTGNPVQSLGKHSYGW